MMEERVYVAKNGRRTLNLKFSGAILLMAMLMGALIVFFGYHLYDRQTIDQYSERGLALAQAAAEVVDWDEIGRYAETGDKDEAYDESLSRLRTLAQSGGVEYLYILMPYDDDGVVYIYDTDPDAATHCELGEYMDWEEAFSPYDSELSRGTYVDPFLTNDEYGTLLSVYLPITNEEGELAGYVGVDYQGDTLIAEEWRYISQLLLISAAIAIIVTALFTLLLRYLLLRPLGRITKAASSYLVSKQMDPEHADTAERNSITDLEVRTGDELQNLSESIKGIHLRIQEYVKILEAANTKAATESMTGLLNHEAFRQRVSLAVRGRRDINHAFIMCDLDNLKDINDTYGHAVGDEAIVACSDLLKKMFRSTDLISRMGGDEFAVFCKGPLSLTEAKRRVEALNKGMRNTSVGEGIHLSVSIGLVYFNGKSEHDYQTLYIAADNALYDAKEGGRDRYRVISL